MTATIVRGLNADVVHYNATRRPEPQPEPQPETPDVVRAVAVGRFKHRTRVAGQIPSCWAPVRRALISNAVSDLLKALERTEGAA